MLRSKTKWIEDGEKNSKYFLNLKKLNYCYKQISSLEVDGKLIKEQRNIAEAQKQFFQNFYSEKLNPSNENYKNSLNDFLINNNIHKLSNSEKELCDQTNCRKRNFELTKTIT